MLYSQKVFNLYILDDEKYWMSIKLPTTDMA